MRFAVDVLPVSNFRSVVADRPSGICTASELCSKTVQQIATVLSEIIYVRYGGLLKSSSTVVRQQHSQLDLAALQRHCDSLAFYRRFARTCGLYVYA